MWSIIADRNGCKQAEKFTIDYRLLNSEEYKNTNLYMKDGLSMQGFTINRGQCSNPNTVVWRNLTDHAVRFHADFANQDNDVMIEPNEVFSYAFGSNGVYWYQIGDVTDQITINDAAVIYK
ncbi:MAG: hypothetical protein WC734_05510 [Patescibacteria group bacterium]|jgi:hypothetical protein